MEGLCFEFPPVYECPSFCSLLLLLCEFADLILLVGEIAFPFPFPRDLLISLFCSYFSYFVRIGLLLILDCLDVDDLTLLLEDVLDDRERL